MQGGKGIWEVNLSADPMGKREEGSAQSCGGGGKAAPGGLIPNFLVFPPLPTPQSDVGKPQGLIHGIYSSPWVVPRGSNPRESPD